MKLENQEWFQKRKLENISCVTYPSQNVAFYLQNNTEIINGQVGDFSFQPTTHIVKCKCAINGDVIGGDAYYLIENDMQI